MAHQTQETKIVGKHGTPESSTGEVAPSADVEAGLLNCRVPGVTIDYTGLEGEGKWRLEQVFRLWCEWYEEAYPKLQSESDDKNPVKGRLGYKFSGGTFVSEEQFASQDDSFRGGESISFNLEYEQRFQRVPRYDRACESISLRETPQDAPPSHHVSPRCFNCGSYNHAVKDCGREYSLSNIKKNKATYTGPIGSVRSTRGRGGGDRRGRLTPLSRRDPKDASGMKRFLARDDVEEPRDKHAPERESGKRQRDWIPDGSRQHQRGENHESANQSDTKPWGTFVEALMDKTGRGQKKPKITEEPKEVEPIPSNTIPTEVIELSSEESMEDVETSDDEYDSDSMDEVILITRSSTIDGHQTAVDVALDSKVPPAPPAPPAPPQEPPTKGGTEVSDTVATCQVSPQTLSSQEPTQKGMVSASEEMAAPAPLLSHKKQSEAVETVASANVPSPRRNIPGKSRKGSRAVEMVRAPTAGPHEVLDDDREEGELDVEEGEIVETPQGPKPVSEPGLFFPVATDAGPEPPADKKNFPANAKTRRHPGCDGQGSHGSRGCLMPPARHPRPSPRRSAQATVKSKLLPPPPPPAPAAAAAAAAMAAAMTAAVQAPYSHRHPQNFAQHQQEVSQSVQTHLPLVGGGLTQPMLSGSQVVHQQQVIPGKFECMGGNNQKTSAAVHPLMRNKGPGTYIFGQNPQSSLPVASSCQNVESQQIASMNQLGNAQLVAQKVVMQRGLVGQQQQQQQPLLSRNPQIVASTSLQGTHTMQHPSQMVQQPFVHFSGPPPQPGAIGLQQEHHGQMVGVPGQVAHVANGRYQFAKHQHHQQPQPPPQHYVAQQPALQQQLVQVGSSMVVINAHGQQVVVKPAGR